MAAEKIAEFKFLVPIAKAVTGEEGELFVEGIASTPSKDKEGEIITAKGQASMAQWANTGEVVLGGEANHFNVAFDDDLGTVVKGEVLEDGGFFVRARLDGDNPRAVHLHKKLSSGTQLGLSVFGKVTKARKAEDGTPLIDGVALQRITVVKRPMNPETWLGAVAKSLSAAWEEEPDEEESDTLDVARGRFLELLQQKMAQEAGPEGEIAKMVGLLWNSADQQDWAVELSSEQRATAIAGAVAEFKATTLAKADDEPQAAPEPEAVPDPVPEPDAAKGPTEAPPAPEEEAPAAPQVAKAQAPEPEPTAASFTHPAVRVANSFARAAHLLFSDDPSPQVQRDGMQALVGKLAQDLDETLPQETPEAGMPAWAAKLLDRMDALEGKLAPPNTGAVTAKAEGTEDADESDAELATMRKSVGPEIRPSRSVAKARSFRDIVRVFYAGGEFPQQP